MAELGPRQGVGDDRLDDLLAMRAPIAMDGVLVTTGVVPREPR